MFKNRFFNTLGHFNQFDIIYVMLLGHTICLLQMPPNISSGYQLKCSLANNEETMKTPDEMPQNAAFHQGLHCLLG